LRPECIIIPNPWDLDGVRHLEKPGFKAPPSTGTGSAWSMGREDEQLIRDEV
jgi:2-methylisocitrate lyase-like PEP mutase family enzyme